MTENREPTVMVVDDEEMVLSALRGFLELETRYRVLTFAEPTDALDALDGEHVDVVVADFMMPGIDGITFLRRVRERRPSATRILLTGYADKENAIRAINEAALYQYVEKPWENDELKLIIRNGIERAELMFELDRRIAALEETNEELSGLRRRLAQAFL